MSGFSGLMLKGRYYQTLPFMLPLALNLDIETAFEAFALNPTEETLEIVTQTLENMRQELLDQGAFVKWGTM